MQLPELPLATLSGMIADRKIKSEALVAACLARIAAREDAVHAWAHLDADHALKQARTRDAEPPRSALHGLPIA